MEGRPLVGARSLGSPVGSIWPQPIKDLDRAVAVSCRLVRDQAKLGTPTNTGVWEATAIVAYNSVEEARRLVADYSGAELRRAVEARQ